VTLACCASARAAAPVLDYLYPAGGRQGATVTVSAGGSFEPWPVSGWSDCAGLHVEPAGEKGQFNIRIDADAPPGPHLVRLHNGEGASGLRVFVVGDQAEVLEAEPNNGVSQATPVGALPATANGRLEARGDVDSYAVKLEAGQVLVASLRGRRLGAPMDPLLHLHDASGHPVAFAHDGLGLDPLLAFRAERAGTYYVRVAAFAHPPAADVSLTGGPATVYRLSLTTGPFVRYAVPAGVARGARATVQLFGWNLAGPSEAREVDAADAPPDRDHLPLATPGGEHPLRLELGDGPELTDASELGAPLAPPLAVTGRISRPGEEDAVPFAAKKDEKLIVTVRAGAMNSPVDATLRILDADGKQLVVDDDAAGGSDPRLEWVAPADGTYRAVVADLNALGGDDYVYRLAIQRPAPRVAAALDAHEYRITAGATVAVKLAVARQNGHADKLVAAAIDLPPGVTCPDVDVPEAGGEVTLTLTAAPDARPTGAPIRIILRAAGAAVPAAAATYDLAKDAGQELVDRSDEPWLTVLGKPPG
jgi:hypothetical protein